MNISCRILKKSFSFRTYFTVEKEVALAHDRNFLTFEHNSNHQLYPFLRCISQYQENTQFFSVTNWMMAYFLSYFETSLPS